MKDWKVQTMKAVLAVVVSGAFWVFLAYLERNEPNLFWAAMGIICWNVTIKLKEILDK